MYIIILGSGHIPLTLAEALATQNHTIVLVDNRADILAEASKRLDIATVCGHFSYPDVLKKAGAEQADVIMAVSDNDEMNMVACQVAYSLFSIPKKIAKIGAAHYFFRHELFSDENMPIDVFINPQKLIAQWIRALTPLQEITQHYTFVQGKLSVITSKIHETHPLKNAPLSQQTIVCDDIKARIVAVYRRSKLLPQKARQYIKQGDEVYLALPTHQARAFSEQLSKKKQAAHENILIAGGGNIGYQLAFMLQDELSVKIIEANEARCQYLSKQLPNVTVLQGDASNRQLLIDENIQNTDLFCATTNDDENNILSALQAKFLGAKTIMALIQKTNYIDVLETSRIDVAISPQQATLSTILSHIRQGHVVRVEALQRIQAEINEVIVDQDGFLANKSLKQLKLPASIRLVGLTRSGEVIPVSEHTQIKPQDHLIVMLTSNACIEDFGKRLLS